MAHYTCQAQYPLAERYRRAPTRAQQELIYHHLIEEAVPCLEARGYSTAPPSSLDTFLEAAPGERWDPYVDGGIDRAIEADVLNGTLSDYSEIYHLCPPLPPDDVYYAEH
ncbi:MAG: hypothetical protein Q4G34_08010 [Micrococcus sp.]|nr:hypothetical protein [Micrococcus sp.]